MGRETPGACYAATLSICSRDRGPYFSSRFSRARGWSARTTTPRQRLRRQPGFEWQSSRYRTDGSASRFLGVRKTRAGSLALAEGDAVTVLVKATEVMIGK
jgi:hypothetical protein